MKFDIFYSIAQTPVNGYLPSEQTMFRNFFDQVIAADNLGFETAWIAESHLSSQTQKKNKNPVIPFWEGEVGLNTDIYLLSQKIFSFTKNLHVGSSILNIVCNGGPIAAAERIAQHLSLHGLNTAEKRKLRIGFAAGRFDFMNEAHGIKARNTFENVYWSIVKGKMFQEASEIFLRLLSGEEIDSTQVPKANIVKNDFRSLDEYQKAIALFGKEFEFLEVEKFWNFEKIKIVPTEWRKELLDLLIGSHDQELQKYVNQFLPVKVFNLSITKPETIEETHQKMSKSYHPKGGSWKREYMPRTVMVFINEDSKKAHEEAEIALSQYWKALQGTIDPSKVKNAAQNALIGNPEEIASEIKKRFHPEDALMLWFDFFNHDSKRVIQNMEDFIIKVVPQV